MDKPTTLEYLFGGTLLILLIKEVVIPLIKKNKASDDDKVLKIEKLVNILWDSHNEKKEESRRLNDLSDKFVKHDRDFSIFSERYEWHFNETNKKFEEIKQLIQHKENSTKQQTDTIFSVLERIEDKLEGK